MDTSFFSREADTHTSTYISWDLDEMVDQVRRSLCEEVDPILVRQMLLGILSDYEDARILTFVPVLACRSVIETLKGKQ